MSANSIDVPFWRKGTKRSPVPRLRWVPALPSRSRNGPHFRGEDDVVWATADEEAASPAARMTATPAKRDATFSTLPPPGERRPIIASIFAEEKLTA